MKKMIVDSLMLEDVRPEDIDSEQALFVEGLGLDSIDALELAIAIDNTFGVRIKPTTRTRGRPSGASGPWPSTSAVSSRRMDRRRPCAGRRSGPAEFSR